VSVVKWVLLVLGAWTAAVYSAALLWIAWVQWATHRNIRRHRRQVAELMDDLTRIERSNWTNEGESK
jgi:Flp pilus assembly protein TadB